MRFLISEPPAVTITLHLHNVLRQQTPAGLSSPASLTLPAGTTLAGLLAWLEITFPADALLLVVNRRTVGPEHILQEGDTVHLMPALAGGA